MRSQSRILKPMLSLILALAFFAAPSAAQQRAAAKRYPIKPDERAALDRISANSLKGHLSFIASDLLEGRGTPSRGLDIAAEYIAAQFRRAGLEPPVNGSYFQTTNWAPRQRRPNPNNPATPATPTAPAATPAPAEKPPQVRNVIGLLRGSDAKLADTYILVTAHYDHLGMRPNVEGDDKIFNGANDDGSGTVSVIELAAALAAMKQRPKRSIVFMTFYGEESGLVGSRYYGANPVFPIDKTIANINLEHVGRTDDSEGAQVKSASVTGIDFSDVGTVLQKAGELQGIRVYKHERNSDSFFGRSDNQALADQGVPAHTLCTTFIFPDYHKVSDHWDKVDYDNMAQVNRAVALALLMLANDPVEPKWNAANPKAEKYLNAWKARRQQTEEVKR